MPYSSNSVQWRPRATQWSQLINAHVTLLCCRVYSCIKVKCHVGMRLSMIYPFTSPHRETSFLVVYNIWYRMSYSQSSWQAIRHTGYSVGGRFQYPQWCFSCRKIFPMKKSCFSCRKIFDKKNIWSRSRSRKGWSRSRMVRSRSQILRPRLHHWYRVIQNE